MGAVGELSGKTAIVTGGATGIGLAAARLLAERGAWVAILGHDREAIEDAVETLEAEGLTTIGLVADVTDENAVAKAFEEFERQAGPLSVLVCSAGIQPYGTVESTDPSMWDKVLSVNLRGAYVASHFAVPSMKRAGGGSVILVASVQGSATQQRVAAYTASKGGLLALTRAMAVDHAEEGIRVNSVSPGCIDAPMTHFSARMNATEDKIDALIASWGRMQPIGRVGRPSEVAEVISFLASDRSSFCTGSDFRVDGGLLAKLGVALPD